MSADKTILIVDDSMVSRMMIRAIVAEAEPSWQILEAKNSQEAVDKIKSVSVDFVTLDMNMPGENGLQVAPRLMTESPNANIALMTANVQDSVRCTAEELGLTFIPKPITEENVLQFIQS